MLTRRARLSKLRSMSAAEIAGRVRYAGVLAAERLQHRTGRLAPPDRLASALLPSLRGEGWQARLLASRAASAGRPLPGTHQAAAMRSLFDGPYRRERLRTLDQAQNARARRFRFFGQEFHYEGEIAWQADPVSRRPWPAAFHADVPVHRGDIGCGDVKYVWELSRQQYLIDLGKAYFLDQDTRDLEAVRDLVRSWIAGNPYATGVNWSCALEPAFRSLSWLWAYLLTMPALDEGFHLEWLCAFHDHGRFLDRHLEEYSSPFNHLVGEAAVLFMLGATFPEFESAPRWRARARRVLEHRLHQQFYADGGSVEQSTFYHHATLGFYLLAALTSRATGEELAPAVWSAIERALEFSMRLAQPDGKTPEIGGADDGKPIRMEHLPFWDFRPYLAIGAVLFGRADFKFVAGRFHEDALWLLGPDGRSAFEAIGAVPPEDTSSWLATSGYWVMRTDWSDRSDYVCLDCGEQAAGLRTDDVPNAMHGHADGLSVIAWLNGRRVLVDSGLYAYNCGGDWESHFRETAAHNTARVDGRDQATHIGKMAWSHTYRTKPEDWHREAGQVWALGSHDGYARGENPVTHRRAVWLRQDSCLVIFDEFTGRGDHDLEVNFQFAPGDLELFDGHRVLFDRSVDVVWLGSVAWTAEFRNGGPRPDDGWIAPSLGVRQAAPRLTLRCRTSEARTTLLTVLASRVSAEPRAIRIRTDGSATSPSLVAVSGEGWTDWITGAELAAGGPIDSDALVSACRMRGDIVVARNRIAGSRLDVDAARLSTIDPFVRIVSGAHV